ncbi:ABC transporter [Novosphingobium sp.]|uniref:ABC transporter n=1 Tax=Novosphingobium sp. TaxID=1874826 RepID=UPI0028AB60EB|nr:ABC transporter [Novosphingobium sp.]
MSKRAVLRFSKSPEGTLRSIVMLLVLAGALALAACGDPAAPRSGRAIGLYTSLPIVWSESGDIRELLASERPQHWALAALSSAGPVIPLDSLADGDGSLPLPRDALLVLAQPRPLGPQENVALDRWVREGGRVLLFADPMLTAPTAYALGDPRRPQDTVLLSPILTRWGLRLEFDEVQPSGEHMVETTLGAIPVNFTGRFRVLGNFGESGEKRGREASTGKSGIKGKVGDAPGICQLEAEGLIARCRVEKGRVLAVSDASILEEGDDPDMLAQRRKALAALIARAESGD